MITGGAGFIGSHLARRMLRDGWRVSVIDDLSGGTRDAVPSGAELIVQDVSSEAVVEAIADLEPDVVIHAAAQVSVPTSMSDPRADWNVNVVGTYNVVRGCLASNAARLVFVSSGGAVYGETGGADESSLPCPKSYYAAHKYVAERYVEMSGLGYAIARLANVYGPGQRAGLEGAVIAMFASAIVGNRDIVIHGTGEQSRDFVHVEDVVDALVLMGESGQSGLWNVGSGHETKVVELLRAMWRASGRMTPVSHLPERPGDVFRSRLIIDRIKDDLGWSPSVSLDEGIRTVLEGGTRMDG